MFCSEHDAVVLMWELLISQYLNVQHPVLNRTETRFPSPSKKEKKNDTAPFSEEIRNPTNRTTTTTPITSSLSSVGRWPAEI